MQTGKLVKTVTGYLPSAAATCCVQGSVSSDSTCQPVNDNTVHLKSLLLHALFQLPPAGVSIALHIKLLHAAPLPYRPQESLSVWRLL